MNQIKYKKQQMMNSTMLANESGRSMVEMLGVLAIIGVLSVGGIAGYTTAMNSHRANETANQARRLAMLVSAQRLSNPNGGSLSSEELGSKFTFDSATTDSIKLTATGLNPKVAARIKDMDMKIASITDGENGSLVFTFKNDISERSGGGSTDSIDTGTCTNGNVYLSYAEEGHECDTAAPENMGCKKNSDCASGEYCKITGAWQNDCAEITGGTCETLDAGTSITYTHTYTSGGESETKELLLGGQMSWWAAENWCKAHHKSLVKASTLGCTASGAWGSCPSDVYSDMNTAKLGDLYWTAETYDSCGAGVVVVVDGGFEGYSRSYTFYALCE